LQKLIVEPMQLVLDLPNQPVVIIIDGLDECKEEGMQSHILRLLGSVFQHHPFGGLSCVCFIVTSRPEPWIHNEFDMEPLSLITRPVFLGLTAEASDDIRTFFRAGFTEIHNSPTDRLNIITSISTMVSSPSTPKPLAALDQLYSQILSTACDK
jgi:hypothetical protein